MATKDEIVRTIEQFQSDLEQIAGALPEGDWSRGVYESGWNAGQLLCHIASTSGVAGFILNMAQASAPAMPGGGAFNIDDFNKMQVEMRAGKSATELISEIRGNFERDIDAVTAADDALISKHFKSPWDTEGEVGDMIVSSFHEHLGMHLADLKAAAA